MKDKTIRPIVLALLLLAVTTTVLPAPQATSDEQKINHILNRLGFGPRPGDVDRVRKIGIRDYIEQQLHPERISDSRTDDKVASFSSLKMTRDQIIDQY